MAHALRQLNENLEPGQPAYTYRLFDAFVPIRFDAAVERHFFQQEPSRIIRRRHSVFGRLQPLLQPNHPQQQHQQQQQEPQQQQPQQVQKPQQEKSQPAHRKRAASSDHRYVGPEELRSALDSFRSSIGKFILSPVNGYMCISLFLKFRNNMCSP